MPEEEDEPGVYTELNGGGGGDFGGGDSYGNGPGDNSGDVVFSEAESEVFVDNEIEFDEDEVDVSEVWDVEEVQEEFRAMKAGCNAAAVEAGKNSSTLWAVASGLGLLTAADPALAFTAAGAGLAASAQSYMGSLAQQCANDPPRPDIDVVACFRPLPLKAPSVASKRQAATYAVAAAALQVAGALNAFQVSIDRFFGARLAMGAAEEGARRGLVLQMAAIIYNARRAGLQITRLTTATTKFLRELDSFSDSAAATRDMTVRQVVEAVDGAGRRALAAFDVGRTPRTLSNIEAQVEGFVAAIREGSVTPASIAASFPEDRVAASAIAGTGSSLQSLVSAFVQAGNARPIP
jgi:hypothetical protein